MPMNGKYYINSFAYEIEQTARICHEAAKKVLVSFTAEISLEEFSLLDTIIAKPKSSQADLARLILKGKAHTGRFLTSLEKKNLIKRQIEERDGKLIKTAVVTIEGLELYDSIMENVKPQMEEFSQGLLEEEVKNTIFNLSKFRKKIVDTYDIRFE
jgi:DNA-binding MarR family transcriptional regulator